MPFSIIELISMSHGFFGLVVVMGLTFALANILNKNQATTKMLRAALFLTLLAVFVIVIMGNFMYGVYSKEDNLSVQNVIHESSRPWADTVLMEMKKYVGNYLPILVFISFFIASYYNDELFTDKEKRIMIALIVLATLLLTLMVFGMGAFITKMVSL